MFFTFVLNPETGQRITSFFLIKQIICQICHNCWYEVTRFTTVSKWVPLNFQIMFSFLCEVTSFTLKTFARYYRTPMLVSNMTIQITLPVWYEVTRFTTEVWTLQTIYPFDVKSPHWKHLKNTLDTRFKLLCLFIMWTSRLCFLFLWSHAFHTGNICKIL